MGTAEIIYVYEVKIVPYVNQLTDRFSDATVGCLENLAVVCLIQGYCAQLHTIKCAA